MERLQENTTKEIKEISIKRYELWQRQSTKSFKFKINFELIDRMSCNVAQKFRCQDNYYLIYDFAQVKDYLVKYSENSTMI